MVESFHFIPSRPEAVSRDRLQEWDGSLRKEIVVIPATV